MKNSPRATLTLAGLMHKTQPSAKPKQTNHYHQPSPPADDAHTMNKMKQVSERAQKHMSTSVHKSGRSNDKDKLSVHECHIQLSTTK